MKRYAKFIDDKIKFLARVPNASHTTPDMLADYATKNGWKEYIATNPPNSYYTMSHKETAKRITETWEAMPLDIVRPIALDAVQDALDKALARRAVIPCNGFDAGIIYDEAALVNAMGMAAGDMYIDAQDGMHMLTADTVDAIKRALKEYRQGLYASACGQRAAIAAATTVDDIAAALV